MISLFVAKIKTQFWRNSKILDEIWKFDYSTVFENYFINKKNQHTSVGLFTFILYYHKHLSSALISFWEVAIEVLCVVFSEIKLFLLIPYPFSLKLFLSPQKLKNFSGITLLISNPTRKNKSPRRLSWTLFGSPSGATR